MCLTIYNSKKSRFSNFPEAYSQDTPDALVADKDIVCYKVLSVDEEKGVKKYNAPYYKYTYEKNVVYNEPMFERTRVIFSQSMSEWERRGWLLVDYGFHSFVNLKLAEYECAWWRTRTVNADRKFCIVKCIIPKGSKYYRGFFVETVDGDQLCYCSESIKITEIIEC